MNRSFVRIVFIAAFLIALLVACEQTPMGSTLDIDVDPDDARITVTREFDGAVVHEGFGDVTLRSLVPGTYVVTTGEGDDLVVRYVTVGVRDRERFTLQIMASKGPGGGGGGGKGDSYSELLLLFRDAHGVPLTVEYETSYCVQPITTEPVPNPYHLLNRTTPEGETPDPYRARIQNPVDGRDVTLVPLFAHYPDFLPVEVSAAPGVGTAARPIAPGPPDDHEEEEDGGEPCDPLVITLEDGTIYSYATFAKEVELERLNLARAPKHVLLQHMREVEALILATDPYAFTLDAAGRPTFDGITIDAMPKLQGMREALLETGTLPGAAEPYPFPFQLVNEDFDHWSPWELSSFALGGAASKFGTINVDAVAYHDRVMGIAVDMVGADGWPRDPHYSAELHEYFVNYSGFDYDREATFPGCVVYLDPAIVPAAFTAQHLLDVVGWSDKTPKQSDLAGYAQMAEDARAVIYFIHLYDATVAYVDPVGLDSWEACEALATKLNSPPE